MNSKQLPMKYPPIDDTARHAFLLSAIYNYSETLPWIYCNYIQLISEDYGVAFTSNTVDDSKIRWLDQTVLSRDLIFELSPNINQFIINCINKNYYVQVMLNEFYIPDTQPYKKYNLPHPLLVHGYDESSFYLAGFFSDARKYTFEKRIKFSDFSESFYQIGDEFIQNKWQIDMFRIKNFKELEEKDKFYFDVELVSDSLNEYLSSTPVRHRRLYTHLEKKFVYGMNIYCQLNEYFEDLIYSENKTLKYRVLKGIYSLYKHKTLMIERVDYMIKHKYLKYDDRIYSLYKEIVNNTQIFMNILLRYTVTKNLNSLANIGLIIRNISEKEKEAIEIILDRLILQNYSDSSNS